MATDPSFSLNTIYLNFKYSQAALAAELTFESFKGFVFCI